MSSTSTPADVADAIRRQAVAAGVATPGIRGADWQTVTVTAVNTDGTVDCDTIRARRVESYANPVVGDRIMLTRSSSGNWIAVARLVTTADGIGHIQVRRRTSDLSRSNTNVPANDTQLTFTVTANANYVMDGWIKYSALTDLDISIAWETPSGSLGEWAGFGAGLSTTAGSTAGYSIRTEANDVGQARNFSGTNASNELTVLLRGVLRVQATGGTYTMQWSQGNVGSSPTTVYTDSWVRIQRVA